VYDGLNTLPTTEQFAFSQGFTGGARVSSGDVNGDGVVDVITVSGPGTSVQIKVFDGITGNEIRSILAYEATFLGGGYIASADINRDGFADMIVSPDQGGSSRIRIFDGKTGDVLADFLGIEDPDFRGGARVSTGDLNGDGWADLLVGAGFGGGPRIAGFDGRSMAGGNSPVKLFNDFFVFEQTLRNGVFLAAGDFNGDGASDLIVGGGPGGGPRVQIFSGRDLTGPNGTQFRELANFFAGDILERGGVRITAKDLDGDGFSDLVSGTGDDAGSIVRIYRGSAMQDGTADLENAFQVFPALKGGIFVG